MEQTTAKFRRDDGVTGEGHLQDFANGQHWVITWKTSKEPKHSASRVQQPKVTKVLPVNLKKEGIKRLDKPKAAKKPDGEGKEQPSEGTQTPPVETPTSSGESK